jgi:hypothetical protein
MCAFRMTPAALTSTLATRTAVHAMAQCIWCSRDIIPTEPVVEIGDALMHDRPCREQYEALVYEGGGGESDLPAREPDEPYYARLVDFARCSDRPSIERMIHIPLEVA